VKRSTAIGHLVDTGEVASEQLKFRGTDIGWPVEELWVAGDLLGPAETVDAGSVVLVLDVPPDEARGSRSILRASGPASSSGSGSAHCCGLTGRLRGRSGTTSIAGSHGTGRPVPDSTTLSSTCCGPGGSTASTSSSRPAAELARQLVVELPVSRRHLRTVVERYWDGGWRREHEGYDESPEDHLWRAAAAVSEMQDALDELET
jgi:hypothetical protein